MPIGVIWFGHFVDHFELGQMFCDQPPGIIALLLDLTCAFVSAMSCLLIVSVRELTLHPLLQLYYKVTKKSVSKKLTKIINSLQAMAYPST